MYYTLLILAFFFGPFLGECRNIIALVWPHTATAPERYFDQSLLNLFAHITFVFGVLPDYSFRTALPDWSIGLEMQFYAIFPLAMYFILRCGPVIATVVLVGICVVLRIIAPEMLMGFLMPSFLPIKLHVFFAGMWVIIGVASGGLKLAAVVSTLLLFVSYPSVGLSQIGVEILGVFAIFILADRSTFARVVFVGRVSALLKDVLSNKFLLFLGESSYAVYLLHLLILLPVAAFFAKDDIYLKLDPYLRFGLVALIVCIITYALAFVLYRLVERPGIRLGKQILFFINRVKATA